MFTLLNLMDAMEVYNNGQDNLVFIDMDDKNDAIAFLSDHSDDEVYKSIQEEYMNSEIIEWHIEKHDEYTCIMYRNDFIF